MKLKEWLTVEDAARHLADIASEPVSEADILRFALDGHLTLSVRFVNRAYARIGRSVPLDQAKSREVPALDGDGTVTLMEGVELADGRVVETSDEIVSLSDVWDLTMLGAEALDVEHYYQLLTGGPPVELQFLDGPIVRSGNIYAQIQESLADNEYFDNSKLKKPHTHPDNWCPAGRLPRDAVFVVRVASLDDLRRKLTDAEDDADQREVSPTLEKGSRSGGRPMSQLWPLWVAELTALVHEEGIPDGQDSEGVDSLIVKVADRLASRGLEGPSRATLQTTARTVLKRLRDAGN